MIRRYLVGLDDGHGMKTAGKRTPIFPVGHKNAGQFMHENDFNGDVVNQVGIHLIRCGIDVLFTAPTDDDTPLSTRTKLANNTIKNSFNRPADILISVHANALTGQWGIANGIETLWTKRFDEKLAKVIHKHLTKGTKLTDRGVKVANLHMTRESDMPACLVECGFMDNLKEAELLMSQEYRAECALEIAQGICEYFGVEFIDEIKEEDLPMTKEEKKAFDDLKNIVEQQTKIITSLNDNIKALQEKNKMKEIPEFAKEAVEKAVEAKLVNTPEGGSYDFYRLVTILHRQGLI